MPRNPKLFIHGEVKYITFRAVEGLPLLCTPFMRLIIASNLAKAQKHYPVAISDFMTMGNHVHMALRVIDPACVDTFIRYFKTESAHMINRLMGRRKGKVWEEGYDSPTILTFESLVEKVSYIYTNPQRANLVDTIEQYPNFSSWSVLVKGGKMVIEVPYIKRTDIEPLPKVAMSPRMIREYTKALRAKSTKTVSLVIEPDACFKALGSEETTFSEYRQKVMRRVREIEDDCRRARGNKKVLGAKALKLQSIFKKHTPKKHGRRMICISSDVVIRKEYITRFKAMVKWCREVYAKWCKGNRSIPYPPGFFPPGMRPQASLLPAAFWY
ncbi:MAG: hypothetical protein D6808_08325 [Candidatus Dadabacteria bacterium]|nr:MAG: hypothetical protein D6808_08325 [Candidatus Dadabacteria bacterium]